MFASEARSYSSDHGCSDHGLSDCLCDVTPLAGGVPVRAIPFADRLLEMGLNRASFLTWAEEITTWQDADGLYVVVDA